MPVPVGEDIPQLDDASWEEIQHDHQAKADVEAPEAEADEFLHLAPG